MKSRSSVSLALVLSSRALSVSAAPPAPSDSSARVPTPGVRDVPLPVSERVPVRIESDSAGLHYTLRRLEDDAPIVACAQDCTVFVPRGNYRLAVSETAETRGGSPKVVVAGPTVVTVKAPSHEKRWVGLGVAAGGHAMMFGGIKLVLDNLCFMGTCSGSGSLRTLGTLMILGGGAAAPIGWVQFGTGSAARARVRPMEPGASARTTRVGISSSEAGTTLHAIVSF
jgi:hypothetical protein